MKSDWKCYGYLHFAHSLSSRGLFYKRFKRNYQFRRAHNKSWWNKILVWRFFSKILTVCFIKKLMHYVEFYFLGKEIKMFCKLCNFTVPSDLKKDRQKKKITIQNNSNQIIIRANFYQNSIEKNPMDFCLTRLLLSTEYQAFLIFLKA